MSCDGSKVVPWCFDGLPRCAHSALTALSWVLTVHEAFEVQFMVMPWGSHGAYMALNLGLSWCLHGIVTPWCVHGASVVLAWKTRVVDSNVASIALCTRATVEVHHFCFWGSSLELYASPEKQKLIFGGK